MRKLLFVTGLVIIGMISASTPVWAQGLPGIGIEKLVNGQDADTPPGPSIAVGSTVSWSYMVYNFGNVALTNVTVTDDQGVVVTCPKFSLESGEAMVCTAMGLAVPGQYVNIGAAAGMAPAGEWVTASDPCHYYGVLGPGPTGIGAADPSMVEAGEPALLTVTVTPGANPPSTGLAVVCDLSSIGGSNAQTFYDDGASGDATAGDNIFSFTAMVPDTTPDGEKHLPCAISEAEGRPGSASIALITYHDFSDCYMTGGGKLWGPYAPPLPPGKTVFVDYSLLLSCPEVMGAMNDFAGPAPLHPELKMLTVTWGSSNRFTLKSPVKIECGTELPPYFTFISGTGFGTWNWMPGYFISFKFVDNLLTGTRDVASIVISEASNAHRIILHATDARIVTGGHAIHCPIMRTIRR